jgi:SAM-dependent methyltransferase
MTEAYTGHRVLEAMHEAVHYTQAISSLIEKAWPAHAIRVLEFGAGDGAFIRRFREAGQNVDCVEIDDWLRAGLRNVAGQAYANIRDVQSESYDFIYSVNVLEHIPDLVNELVELRRVLRPGGTLFVFVPAFRMLWTSLDTEVGHVTRFTRASLTRALRSGGFKVSRVNYFDSLGFPAALAVRLLEKCGLFSYGGGSIKFYDSRIFPVSRALDGIFQRFVGKNLVTVADRG